MPNQFLPRESDDEREARKLAEGINNGTIILPHSGSTGGDQLPADRDIPFADMLRAARLDTLAMAFAVEAARGADRTELLQMRAYRDLRFHPRYKREATMANKA